MDTISFRFHTQTSQTKPKKSANQNIKTCMTMAQHFLSRFAFPYESHQLAGNPKWSATTCCRWSNWNNAHSVSHGWLVSAQASLPTPLKNTHEIHKMSIHCSQNTYAYANKSVKGTHYWWTPWHLRPFTANAVFVFLDGTVWRSRFATVSPKPSSAWHNESYVSISIYPSFYLCIYLSIYLSIYVSIYLSNLISSHLISSHLI